MIKKEGSKWAVYTSSGKKKLGEHKTKKEAMAQIAAIESSKRRKK